MNLLFKIFFLFFVFNCFSNTLPVLNSKNPDAVNKRSNKSLKINRSKSRTPYSVLTSIIAPIDSFMKQQKNSNMQNIDSIKRSRIIRNLLNKYLFPHVDYQYAALWSLGRINVQYVANNDKRLLREYMDAYKSYLVSFYANIFMQYDSSQSFSFSTFSSKAIDDSVTMYDVPARFHKGFSDKVVKVVFRFRKSKNRWKIYDIETESISMLKNHRVMISSLMSKYNKNIQAVINFLIEKSNYIDKSAAL